jgi:hypothetical protein
MELSQPTADVVLAAIRLHAALSIAIGIVLLVGAMCAAVLGRRAYLRAVVVSVKAETNAADESLFMVGMAKAVGAAIIAAILLATALSHLANSANWIALASPQSAWIVSHI